MGNPKLICIIGRTCTGKDTLSKTLQEYGSIPPLVSYTTRPRRDNEVEGREHYFITETEYLENYDAKEKLAYTRINGYRYFTLYDMLTGDGSKIYSYIVDPIGYHMLKNKFGDYIDIKSIYLHCSKEVQSNRYNNRERKITIPFSMRDNAEDEQFYTFERNEIENCDLIIRTDNFDFVNMIKLFANR